MAQNFLEGNEAIAEGQWLPAAGFLPAIRITPATSIYHQMLQLLPPAGGICMQGEDEIASIGFCLGASMTGLKAMTATSGPGISLYSEQLSFAIGGEIPLVVVDATSGSGLLPVRLPRGPMVTSSFSAGDGGGLPVIVLAPVDVRDCYLLTVQAFNLAERFRCPVFIASNKEIGMSARESVDFESLSLPPLVERMPCPADHSGKPFAPLPGDGAAFPACRRQPSVAPDLFQPWRGRLYHHRPGVLAAGILRLQNKLLEAVPDFTFYEYDGSTDDRTSSWSTV